MSDDYEAYSQWEAMKADVEAKRFKVSYPEREEKPPAPTLYKDEHGKEFYVVNGKREYLED